MDITGKDYHHLKDVKEIKFTRLIRELITYTDIETEKADNDYSEVLHKIKNMIGESNMDFVLQYIYEFEKGGYYTDETEKYRIANEACLRGFINNVIGIDGEKSNM